ncbi:hypothetical protein [Reyranella soli]|uniref:hypothetical protein n=1 Tax=Reyranella soli TaxID=1230389 RepID=UPI0011BF8B7E|nr:hypothetical protein [Reyranella soli]
MALFGRPYWLAGWRRGDGNHTVDGGAGADAMDDGLSENLYHDGYLTPPVMLRPSSWRQRRGTRFGTFALSVTSRT